MPVKTEFRDRDDIDVAILDALVDRSDEGMTVFELRTHVGADIDDIEQALHALKEENLIIVENSDHGVGQPVIKPADTVIPSEQPDDDSSSFVEQLREWLPF